MVIKRTDREVFEGVGCLSIPSIADIPKLDEIARPEEVMDLIGEEDNHGRDSF